MKRTILSAAAAATLGAGLAVAAPGTAQAADPCQLGWSNVGPRTCATTEFRLSPVLTLGNGVCAGMLTAGGTSFDGPLYEYSEAPGATHAVVLRVTQGFSPIGEWGPQLLACDVTVVADWRNLDTGASGAVSRFVPAGQRLSPAIMLLPTGPGRVQVTLRTDKPNIPASLDVFVP
ncbi:hypothetical protein [Nocardia farcinica]|uniref:hypothetical protein n=1 Tax=Nocardia farcinica TaxID=37329 RepID=UPI0024565257|nr:hypothetical protein [Nocardia farcinica]